MILTWNGADRVLILAGQVGDIKERNVSQTRRRHVTDVGCIKKGLLLENTYGRSKIGERVKPKRSNKHLKHCILAQILILFSLLE